jgi:hypothetical protein
MMLPYKVKSPWEDNSKLEAKTVAIDKCLLGEVVSLWEMGIKTTGCCCGHGKWSKAFIGVKPEYIQVMKDLGYKVHQNVCRPGAEDSFTPKTLFSYGEINKGFNWWEE